MLTTTNDGQYRVVLVCSNIVIRGSGGLLGYRSRPEGEAKKLD